MGTVTIDKYSAAKATVDNTASARNTYVYIDGKLHPVRKGQTAALPELTRGKPAAWTFKTGGHDQTVYITWVGQTATFTTPGPVPMPDMLAQILCGRTQSSRRRRCS